MDETHLNSYLQHIRPIDRRAKRIENGPQKLSVREGVGDEQRPRQTIGEGEGVVETEDAPYVLQGLSVQGFE